MGDKPQWSEGCFPKTSFLLLLEMQEGSCKTDKMSRNQ